MNGSIRNLCLGTLGILIAGCASWNAREAGDAYVDEFDLSVSSCGMGKRVRALKSVDGHPLTMRGKTYAHGFGTHPESAVAFTLNGKVRAFEALVGVDDDAKDVKERSKSDAGAVFRVWADGKIVVEATTGERQTPVILRADLLGKREVVLETSSVAPWRAFEAVNADWADARFVCDDGAVIEANDDKRLVAQLGILTPPEKREPQFNGADIWGVRPGHPVIFRVPVTGVKPIAFSAKDLPAGVTFDAKRGILGGVAPKVPGAYPIRITAKNAAGEKSKTITLQVGDTICLTPPMGWNSWNIWGWAFSGEHAKAAARAMDESGLADHGWAYVNLDDWWQMNNTGNERAKKRPEVAGPARDSLGKIIPNPSFPDMKGLTDYIHSFGLKAGLYSSPGPETCGGCEGSYGHELQDAETWAEWGFDYVKYDWCSYDRVVAKEQKLGPKWHWWNENEEARQMRRPWKEKPYRLMTKCLRVQKRDIVHSFCQYGLGAVQDWARDAGANCWRSWDDLKDTWPWMERAIESRIGADYAKYAGPGCWVDPDMMIVGNQRSFGSTHPTFLTPNEQYVHVSVWALVCAPMLIGCDLTAMDAFTKSLLVNDEVIAISQDRLGRAAKRVRHDALSSVWIRPLFNGDVAVGLVNRYPLARDVKATFGELGLSGEWCVRDVWRQADEGKAAGEYLANVPAHGIKFVRLSKVPCAKCD